MEEVETKLGKETGEHYGCGIGHLEDVGAKWTNNREKEGGMEQCNPVVQVV